MDKAMSVDEQIEAAFVAHAKGIGKTPLKVDTMSNVGQNWPVALGFSCGSDDGVNDPIIVTDNINGLDLETGSAEEVAAGLVAASNIMPVLYAEIKRLRAALTTKEQSNG